MAENHHLIVMISVTVSFPSSLRALKRTLLPGLTWSKNDGALTRDTYFHGGNIQVLFFTVLPRDFLAFLVHFEHLCIGHFRRH